MQLCGLCVYVSVIIEEKQKTQTEYTVPLHIFDRVVYFWRIKGKVHQEVVVNDQSQLE